MTSFVAGVWNEQGSDGLKLPVNLHLTAQSVDKFFGIPVWRVTMSPGK